jgi:PA14 domain-containing protein
VKRLASTASRSALAITVFLFVLAVLRWAPVHAEPPWDVRALAVAPAVLCLAIAAALTGRDRRAWPVRWLIPAASSAAVCLAAVVLLRGAEGLPVVAEDAQGRRYTLPAGPIDVVGESLRDLPPSRRFALTWDGRLRVPGTGRYRLWAAGSGSVIVEIDGREVLRGEGDPLRAGKDALLGRGEHRIQVRFDHRGPGLRLRLGWTRPGNRGEPGGMSDVISPRYLGPAGSGLLWRLTDALAIALAGLVAALAVFLPWDIPRHLPLPRPVTPGEIVASLAAHSVLAVLMSWPLVLGLGHRGVVDRVDGRLNAWILAWDAHALTRDPTRIFQAPIFHPLPDALAFTENLILPAAVAAPAILLGNPVLGYNLILLGTCVLSGLGAQLLVRRVAGDRLAAFVAGAAFAVGGHRWVRMAHLHAELTLFLPFVLLALDRFWEKRTWRRALLIGLLLALQGWSSIYLGAITATALCVGIVLMAVAGMRPPDFSRLGAGLVLATVLLAPVVRPYLRMRAFEGAEFTLADQAVHATTPLSYAAAPARLYGPLTRRHLDMTGVRDPLFPGVVLLLLGVAGLAVAPRRYRAFALAASAAAIVVSLGPETAAYRFLYEHLVLFRGIRALGRFSLVPVLALSVLAGLALSGRSRRASLLALALLLAESANWPLRYGDYVPPPAAARWLEGKPGAVAYLPLGGELDTQAMLDGVAHFRPLVNGDSGFVPRSYGRALELLSASTPTPEGLRFLRAVGVRHIVTRGEPSLAPLEQLGQEKILAVPEGPAAHPVSAGREAAVLWGLAGAVLDLGEARPLNRIAFEVGDEAWVERPRLAFSLDGAHWQRDEGRASLADATLSLTLDPRHGLGEVRFPLRTTRYVRLDAALPARQGRLWVGP